MMIHELLVNEVAIDKLGARAISFNEVHQLLGNAHVAVHNPHHRERRLLVGRTDGGRPLTLVIERTSDPATWMVITGWEATPVERRLLGS